FLSGEIEALLFKKPEYCVSGQVCFVASEANHEIGIVKTYGGARAVECTIDSEIRKLITDHLSHSVCAFWFHFCEIVQDRKSTRLNSSHVSISYAVFCLTKKKIQ